MGFEMFLEDDLLSQMMTRISHHQRGSPFGLDKRFGGISLLASIGTSIESDYLWMERACCVHRYLPLATGALTLYEKRRIAIVIFTTKEGRLAHKFLRS